MNLFFLIIISIYILKSFETHRAGQFSYIYIYIYIYRYWIDKFAVSWMVICYIQKGIENWLHYTWIEIRWNDAWISRNRKHSNNITHLLLVRSFKFTLSNRQRLLMYFSSYNNNSCGYQKFFFFFLSERWRY